MHQQTLVFVERGQIRKHLDRRLRRGEVGNARLLEQLAAFGDLAFAHPAGQYRLVGLLRHLDHRLRGFCRLGHCLRRQHGQYAIDAGVGQTGLDGGVITRGAGIADDINRVAMRPGRRQRLIELIQCRFGQLGQTDADIDRQIGRHHTGAAAVGDDGEAVADRLDMRRKRARASEQLHDRLHPHHAGAAHQRIEHRVGAGQRAGMRLRRLGTGFMPADLDHHDRFQARDGAQRTHEAARVANAFDIKQDALGLRVISQVIENLAEVDIGGGAGRNHAGKTDAVGFRPVQHRGTQRTGLRDQRQIAGQRGAQCESCIQTDRRALDTQAVGADEADAVFLRHADDGFLQQDAFGTDFTEAGGQHHDIADATLAAFLHDLGDGRRRRGNDRQIRRFRQIAGVGIAFLA